MQEAAKRLHALADSLERHNEITFDQGGIKHTVKVPKQVTLAIEVEHGDTDTAPYGLGTYASRSTPTAGAATAMAARKIREKARPRVPVAPVISTCRGDPTSRHAFERRAGGR